MHVAFENAGQQAGLEIWRIEKFEPVPYPKKDHGKFYTGDSYIILFTKKNGDTYSWDIHFWLGSQTSQDESGSAAILAVDLDDHLGGVPIQYREAQDHESQRFLNHFKNGVRYLPGGIESGFAHVDPDNHEKRLFQVKGIKNIRVKQVEFGVKSMNKGDCFILDAGSEIMVYVGAKSKRMERLKAIQAANQIRDQDHAGRPKVTIIDEFCDSSEVARFFELLGSGSADDISDEEDGGDDKEFESSEERTVTLYKVSDSSGSLSVEQVATKPLTQDLLDTNDCFILDTARADIFVWIGKTATATEKKASMNHAQSFLKSKNYPAWTRVQRVVEDGEPAAFKQYFVTWSDEKVGEAKLVHVKVLAGGKLSVEQLTDFDQEDLDEDDVMVLDNGCQIFLWIGKDSSADEKEESMKIAKKYHAEAEYDNEIEVVPQGEEPSDFTKVFSTWESDFWATAPSVNERIQRMLA